MLRLKFNWGYFILSFYLLFVGGMIFLVFKCTQHPVDLLSADYYNRELKFQQQLNKEQNALQLITQLSVKLDEHSKKLQIIFPVSSEAKGVSGKIYFMKPDDASLDKTIAVNVSSNNEQLIDVSNWKKGLYQMEVSWADGVKEYYKQTFININ